ncbi:putative glycosidase [Escovopsis weberi]|uniref:Putative glycosidase n=1 Tax=Escovopsis weberi TaxID=150374 RepID=A0A0M8N1A7_ESCWE|nr:putative glycosidase [Escovopsis weberi]
MPSKYSLLVALSALLIRLGAAEECDDGSFDVLSLIDPLIGTDAGGHVFPGATLPYGMAKAVADVDFENQGGFSSGRGLVTGFSHMHDSGTGGGLSLGNFPIFAQTGCVDDDINRCYFTKMDRASDRINSTIEAKVGYFALTLNSSVKAEMTVTNHTALYRFTFPTDGTPTKDTDKGPLPYSPLILTDLTDLPNSRSDGVIAVDGTSGRITGNGTFNPSFGIGNYKAYFCADFRGAELRDSGIFVNNRAGTEPKSFRTFNDGQFPILPAGAWVRFHPPSSGDQIMVRVGLSFISSVQACSNAEREVPDFGFEQVRQAAEDAWRDKLSVIEVDATGVGEPLQRSFWSGIYRSLISPQDYTGENQLWDSAEPYFDSYYCIWDSYRTTHSLITIIDPHAQALMVRSLIDIYRHEGKLPDCRMSFCKGFTQGGSNADNLLADSFVKGLKDGIDWDTGYEAVVSDAEVEGQIWTVEGRGGLESWKKLGYIPTDDWDPNGYGVFTRSISRTVEYSYNDFCIAEMAKGLGKTADAEKYLKRSGNWKNMFDPDTRSRLNITGSPDPSKLVDSGFKGFLQSRFLNGTFGFQDPARCSHLNDFDGCYFNPGGHETYEGNSWLYTFSIPHDQASLIPMLGGPDTFEARIRYMHDTPGLLYIGDEQAFLLVFVPHFNGNPGLSTEFVHRYIPGSFNDTVAGLPGNDDSGAMGSFASMAMMGFFPVSGQDVYLLTAPFFREVSFRHPQTGKTAVIRNKNFDASYRDIYIQSATLNGKPYTKSWFDHGFFTNGGVIELTLGPKKSQIWGVGRDNVPPSSSTHF